MCGRISAPRSRQYTFRHARACHVSLHVCVPGTSVKGRGRPSTSPASRRFDSSRARRYLSCRAPSFQLCDADNGVLTLAFVAVVRPPLSSPSPLRLSHRPRTLGALLAKRWTIVGPSWTHKKQTTARNTMNTIKFNQVELNADIMTLTYNLHHAGLRGTGFRRRRGVVSNAAIVHEAGILQRGVSRARYHRPLPASPASKFFLGSVGGNLSLGGGT